MSTIGERIAELRAEVGETQEQYAAWLHVKRATLANWETNRADPDIDSLKTICTRHGVSLDYIWGRTDIRELPDSPNTDDYRLPPELELALRGKRWYQLKPETRRLIIGVAQQIDAEFEAEDQKEKDGGQRNK